jgi:hypothetical protein
MQIHNAVITGSFSYNGADLSNVTSSNAYSASLSSRTTDLETTASVLVGASASFSSILTSVSSSQQQISASLLNVIAIGATTGSNSFRSTQSITGSLTVTGQIVAQTLNVQQVTSSIVFSSGSNTFGCDLNNRQTFTGSFFQTGSLASFSGQLCVGSSLVLGTNNAYALYLRDSAGNPKPIIATAGNTNLNFYNVCSTGKVNINNAADNAVLVSIDNTGASTFSGQLCSITGVFGTKGGGNYGVLISDNDQSNVRLRFTNTGTGGTSMSIVGGNPGLSNSGLAIYDETNAATRMYITSCGCIGIGTCTPVGKLDVTLVNTRRFIVTYDDSIITIKGASDTGAGENLRMIGDNLIFNTNSVGSGTERMRITSTGIACFACQTCTPQSVITSGFYSTSNMIIITNDVQDGRKTILNNTPVSIFQICKPAGLASSASYSLLGGQLYINLGLRFSGGYTALRTITYPFFINSAGTGNISLVLGTPTCLTGFDNTGGQTTSFGISLCGASNTTATVIVCANTTNFTIEGSTIMTVSMVANRTALLDEPITVFKI